MTGYAMPTITLRLHGEVYIYEVELVTIAKSMNEPTLSCSLFAFSFLYALKSNSQHCFVVIRISGHVYLSAISRRKNRLPVYEVFIARFLSRDNIARFYRATKIARVRPA